MVAAVWPGNDVVGVLFAFAFPIRNMPGWVRYATWLDPRRYDLAVIRDRLFEKRQRHGSEYVACAPVRAWPKLEQGEAMRGAMMYWEEEQNEETVATPSSVVDLSFSIRCKTLPVDNAWLLFRALQPVLPWLESDPVAGIHPLHVAESAHGWQRPEHPEALLHLSRRTKLVLRLPRQRVAEARELEGRVLKIDGHTMEVGEAETLPISRSTALFARHVVIHEEETEERFMQRLLDEMAAMDIRPKKLLPGLSHTLRIADETVCTRLVSMEGLALEQAFRLQERGLGEYRHLGCGIFIPHKPLAKVQV